MTRDLQNEAAALIREHFWQPTEPESPDNRPWTMARELNIWKRLVSSGYAPEQINGAITQARRITKQDGPLRMTVFYWKNDDGFCATPFLERCIGESFKHQYKSESQVFEQYLEVYGTRYGGGDFKTLREFKMDLTGDGSG